MDQQQTIDRLVDAVGQCQKILAAYTADHDGLVDPRDALDDIQSILDNDDFVSFIWMLEDNDGPTTRGHRAPPRGRPQLRLVSSSNV